MYSRSEKDSYRKKIEELIGGKQKRLRKDTSSSKTNTDNDVIINFDNSSNDIFDDSISNINEDVNMTSGDTNKIHVHKWTSGGIKVKDIRKILGTNKINL